MLGDIIRASERAAQLTRQMLAYAGKGAFVVKRIDVCDLVRDTCNLIRTSIPNSVHLKLQLSHDLPPIESDAGQMQQVIMNLVINAAEAIPEGRSGIVVVQTTLQEITERWIEENNLTVNISPGAYLVLEVSDTGRGMDEATKTKMFDPFFTTKFSGRGLGLAAVLGVVVSNRGAIQVNSGLGKGTTIRVLIPAASGHGRTQLIRPSPKGSPSLQQPGRLSSSTMKTQFETLRKLALREQDFRCCSLAAARKDLNYLNGNGTGFVWFSST